MQAPFTVPAQHSGKKGIATVSSIKQLFEWRPAAARDDSVEASGDTIVIQLGELSSLQASPATHPKARLKIKTKTDAQYVFQLPNRANLDALKTVLSSAISAAQQSASTTAAAAADSAAAAVAAGSVGTPAKNGKSSTKAAGDASKSSSGALPQKKGMSDAELLVDRELQQSLLKSNSELQQQFLDAVVKQSLPAEEFWRTRIPLLRMHSLVRTQNRGLYNVLASIKPVSTTQANSTGTETGQAQVKVSLSPDKIKDIFRQYPVVNRAYQENVPPLRETEFWSRFFLSRLCRKLRGERLSVNDPVDAVMDKYLNLDQDGLTAEERERENENTKVMRFVDIEANEEDDSQKAGNQPDITMRPSTQKDALSIIRTFNELSQRIVDIVQNEAEQPEEETEKLKEKELQLQDLEPEAAATRIELHLHRSSDSGIAKSGDDSSDLRADQNNHSASELLRNMKNSLPKGPINELLTSTIPSSSMITHAQSQVFKLIVDRRHTEQEKNTTADAETPAADAAVIREMKLSHATAVEFLHHFWAAFLSGDPARAASVAQLAASVEKSKVRLQAIVDRHIENVANTDPAALEQEKERVNRYVGITLKAIDSACKTYKDLLAKQQKQLQQQLQLNGGGDHGSSTTET